MASLLILDDAIYRSELETAHGPVFAHSDLLLPKPFISVL